MLPPPRASANEDEVQFKLKGEMCGYESPPVVSTIAANDVSDALRALRANALAFNATTATRRQYVALSSDMQTGYASTLPVTAASIGRCGFYILVGLIGDEKTWLEKPLYREIIAELLNFSFVADIIFIPGITRHTGNVARALRPWLALHPMLQLDDLFTCADADYFWRSEEHTSELQSLMRISYAAFCLKKKTNQQ